MNTTCFAKELFGRLYTCGRVYYEPVCDSAGQREVKQYGASDRPTVWLSWHRADAHNDIFETYIGFQTPAQQEATGQHPILRISTDISRVASLSLPYGPATGKPINPHLKLIALTARRLAGEFGLAFDASPLLAGHTKSELDMAQATLFRSSIPRIGTPQLLGI